MVDAATISQLLLHLYDGVIHPESLQEFLNKLALSVDATGAAFREQFFDEVGSVQLKKASLFLTTGYSQESLAEYAKYFHAKDVYVQQVLENHRRAECATSDAIVPDSESHRTEIYNEYQLKHEIGPMMWTKLADQPNYVAAISFHRPVSRAPFTDKELEVLAALTPHVRQVLRLSTVFSAIQTENGVLGQALEDMDVALCMVRSDGIIGRMTPSAESLLAKGTDIWLRDGKLRVDSSAEQRSLDALIESACSTGAGRGTETPVPFQCKSAWNSTVKSWTAPHGGALLITRHEPLRPLQVTVSPFRDASHFGERNATALIMIADPAAIPRSRSAVLKALYGLTPTEARLADLLLKGLEVREIADQMKITLETARFNLKRILVKTGTRRQPELIRLMLSIPGSPARV